MTLSTGARIDGIVTVYGPVGYDRLSDYTRRAKHFRYVVTPFGSVIVNCRPHRGSDREIRFITGEPLCPSPPAIDRLFRLMCERGASDLHLCVGMPPLVRKDGEIQPLEPEAAALTPENVVALLDPILPAKNRKSSGVDTTPISPTRFPGWRAFAPTCSWIARDAAPCSA